MPLQSVDSNIGKGLCLLSLDAGGARGISQLKILEELMHQLNFDFESSQIRLPCSVFDMIGGTGSGGFIAILLVIFGLTLEQAKTEFVELSVNVLEKKGLDAKTRTSTLKDYTQSLIKKYNNGKDMRLLDPNSRSKGCKLLVPISYKDHVGSTCNLRNFGVRQEQALNLTITEAILATLATPPVFTSTSVFKDDATFKYIGSDFTLSNATREIIAEAHGAVGSEREVACVLSIGCGHPGMVATPGDSEVLAWHQFLEKIVSNSEQEAQSIDSQMGHLSLYYRFSVTRGLENTSPAANPDLGEVLTHTAVYLSDAAVKRSLAQCTKVLSTRNGVASLEQLRRSGGHITLSSALPPLTPTFIMRKKAWEFIEGAIFRQEDTELADESRMLVVTGIGGCGKTQLILKFIRVHKSKFTSSLFIDGSSETRIRADITRHARSLEPRNSQMSFEDCLLVLAQPSFRPRLIVYDNVDDPELDLSALLPQGDSCAIIATSRNRALGELCPNTHLELDVMTMNESVELLLPNAGTSLSGRAREDTRSIAEALGCLPIALAQARSYMYQTRCSTSEYLDLLTRMKQEMLARPIKNQRHMRFNSTDAAFKASFGRLNSRDQLFIRLLSYFHWRNFPSQLVVEAGKLTFLLSQLPYYGSEYDPQSGRKILEQIFLDHGEWSALTLDNILMALQSYSLVTVTPGTTTRLVHMHPLAHEWVHKHIPEDERSKIQSASIVLLLLGDSDAHTTSAQFLANHVLYMTPLWSKVDIHTALSFGRILRSGGLYHSAVQIRENVVQKLRAQGSQQKINLSIALVALANGYTDLGRLRDAEEKEREALQIRTEMLGEDHFHTMIIQHNLAHQHLDSGRPDQAKLLLEKVLKVREMVLGQDHPDTLDTANTLASAYRDLQMLEHAEAMQVDVIKRRKRVLGNHHPKTLSASSNLAIIYRRQDRLEEAKVLQEDNLKTRKEVLGNLHPETLAARGNLAITYRELGRFDDAKRLEEKLWRSMKKVLGERHPDTLRAYENLAKTYHKLGRLNDAEKAVFRVLEFRGEVLGAKHPKTVQSMMFLAQIYVELGRIPAAQRLYRAAGVYIHRTEGTPHPGYGDYMRLRASIQSLTDQNSH